MSDYSLAVPIKKQLKSLNKLEENKEKGNFIYKTLGIFERGDWDDTKESLKNKLKQEASILKSWEYKNNLKKSLKEEIEEDNLF